MKVSAIVYTSNTGFTAQYATLLSHQTGLPLHQLKECTLPQGTQVLYLGWLCAGKVQGLKKAAARFRVEAVCAVGMAPECDPAKLVGDNHCNGLPLFYLRGGYTPARVRGKYKMMMACSTGAPIRHIVINSGGLLPEWLADLLLEAANGRFLCGIRKLFTRRK